jgi:hypothetical protein
VAYWITLGAAAGAAGGALVGGVGGRIGMFVLRLTSPDYVRGLESDDGFEIGVFDALDTLNLVVATAVMGAVVGLLVVLGRPFFPYRWMPLAWALAGAAIGGGLIVRSDGVDFTLLEPLWLAMLMFIAIPAAGAALIALLVGVYQRFWWHDWRIAVVLMIPAIPAVIVAPFVIAAGVVVLAGIHFGVTMDFWRRWPVRAAAAALFVLLTVFGAVDLGRDAAALT